MKRDMFYDPTRPSDLGKMKSPREVFGSMRDARDVIFGRREEEEYEEYEEGEEDED